MYTINSISMKSINLITTFSVLDTDTPKITRRKIKSGSSRYLRISSFKYGVLSDSLSSP